MQQFAQLLKIVRRKSIIDQNNDWSEGSITYLNEIQKEIQEVLDELTKNRNCYLEEELGDVLWDYLNILIALEKERAVSVDSILNRCCQKYEERISGIEKGELWKNIKTIQKTRLVTEQQENNQKIALLPELSTERTIIRFLVPTEAELVKEYFITNKEHLAATMPEFGPELQKTSHWKKRLKTNIQEFKQDSSCRFFILPKSNDKVIGTINFTEIIRGVFQGCFLGYGIDSHHQGQGLMTETVKAAINFMFSERNLHKILANYMPSNHASGQILKKLGFELVGLAKGELYLSGQWQDHMETRLINPNWKTTL